MYKLLYLLLQAKRVTTNAKNQGIVAAKAKRGSTVAKDQGIETVVRTQAIYSIL